MSNSDLSDFLDSLLSRHKKQEPLTKYQARMICDTSGHKYQVHGKRYPTKLTCTRCQVSWAIGARTEPTT